MTEKEDINELKNELQWLKLWVATMDQRVKIIGNMSRDICHVTANFIKALDTSYGEREEKVEKFGDAVQRVVSRWEKLKNHEERVKKKGQEMREA